MNAAKKYQSNWEEINEQRLVTLYQISFSALKTVFNLSSAVLNVAIFIAFRTAKLLKAFFRATALAHPIVKVEREEAWLFRQIK